jgi:NitT/TauT family transport system substrate-binding protein
MRGWLGKVVAVLGVLALLAVAGCGDDGGGGDDASGDGTTSLVIAATGADSIPFMAILQVAIDKGWYEEEGLDVSLFSGGGGGDTLRIATSGEADMAIAGNTAVVLAAQQPDSNLTVVAPWFQVNDISFITPDADATLDGAVLAFSRAGSTSELTIQAIANEHPDLGITGQQVGQPADSWVAAESGQVTAAWALHPFITEKVEAGGTVLVDARDEIGDFPMNLVAVNSDYAEDHADELRTFFEVTDRAFDYVVDDTEDAAADIAEVMGLDAGLVQRGLEETPELDQAYSLTVVPDALANLSDLMVSTGQIDEPIDWSELLDQQYLPDDARADL